MVVLSESPIPLSTSVVVYGTFLVRAGFPLANKIEEEFVIFHLTFYDMRVQDRKERGN